MGVTLNQSIKDYINDFDPHCLMSEESLKQTFYEYNKSYIEYRRNAK
jgi:hypothetical protein